MTDIPRLGQCYLCKAWRLEKDLHPIEVPDQGGGYIQKLACESCLDAVMGNRELKGEVKSRTA